MAEASNKIEVKAVLSPISDTYRLVVINQKSYEEQDLLDEIAQVAGKEAAQVRYLLDLVRIALLKALAKNKVINCGFFKARLTVGGSLESANEQPTPEKNPVSVSIVFTGSIPEITRSLQVVNSTLTVPAVLHEFMQDGASDKNRIESPTARIIVNGERIAIDPNAPDEGLWLENANSGVKVATATLVRSTSTFAHFKFETLPATGMYRFVLATRNGESPDEYAPKRLTRNVFVVNGGEA